MSLLLMVLTSLLLSAAPAGASGDPERRARAPLAERVSFGAWVHGMTLAPLRLTVFEELIGARTGVASYYWGYGDVFPGPVEHSFADGGEREVLVSWDMGPTRFTDWSDGSQDDYLDTLVEAARDYPYDVHVRPWPEMNGDWQSFQPTVAGDRVHGGTYAEFVTAWRYLVDYFRDRGVDNLKWVFNPTTDVYAETTTVADIWPGEEYVDVLGLDGFNWGADDGWGRWQSFVKVMRPQYRRLVALHPTAPVWVCEVASKEPRVDDGAPVDHSRSKGTWIRQAMRTRAFPRMTAVVWFNEDKERDWRVDSSPEALEALRRWL